MEIVSLLTKVILGSATMSLAYPTTDSLSLTQQLSLADTYVVQKFTCFDLLLALIYAEP
jgi:hypothetical protein